MEKGERATGRIKVVDANRVPGARTKWVEIDLDTIGHNVREIRRFLRPEVKMAAIVKADAYGHGAVPTVKTVLANGADVLGVTSVSEAQELRRAGIVVPILVLGSLLPDEAPAVVKYDLTPALFSLPVARRLDNLAGSAGKIVAVHLNVDTGMGRYGLSPEQMLEFARTVREMSNLSIEGIFTHFAAAFTMDKQFTHGQFERFRQVCEALADDGLHIPCRHAASSAAVLRYPETHLDMVRVGALLYGQGPVPEINTVVNLRPAWQLKTRLVHVREMPAGANIGYGQDFRLPKATTAAVIPVGYADGFAVQPVNRPVHLKDVVRQIVKDIARFLNLRRVRETVAVKGRPAPLIGRVGMQHCVLDVGRIEDVAAGEEIVLDGKRSIVSPRIPRYYRRDGNLCRYRAGIPDGRGNITLVRRK